MNRSFGQQGLDPVQWEQCLERLGQSIAHFPQQPQEQESLRGFDWPLPNKGLQPNRVFNQSIGRSRSRAQAIPVAFPRFHDIYEEAGVQPSWGRVQDRGGETFRETLDGALESGAHLVQIATWNDWGEGTVIEPSEEFRFRDLEIVQQRRRSYLDAEFPYQMQCWPELRVCSFGLNCLCSSTKKRLATTCSPTVLTAVPSAREVLTTEFGMGSGVALPL